MRKLENQNLVDQQAHPALVLLAARPELFAQQGTVSSSWRRRGGKTYGPYYRLRYRDGRSCRSLYLGRDGPLVDRVRNTLQTLQTPLRRRRALAQLRRRVRVALQLDRRQVDARLRSLGLRLKGFEVRGWRTSPLRTLARLSATGSSPVASMRIKPFRLPRVRQGTVPIFVSAKMGLSPSALLRRLRFVPKGGAAIWLRENRPKIPRLPQARLQAVLDARDRAAHNPRR